MITKMFDQSIERTIDFIAKHVLVEWGLLGVLASVVTQSLGSSMALFSVPILAVLVLLPRRLRAVRA
jgi:hypothetical protein